MRERNHLKGRRGQAVIELAVMFVVLATLVLGAIELGYNASLSMRLAATAREGGRLIIAANITPDPSYSTASNSTNLATLLNNTVYADIDTMTQPSDLPNKGRVIVSYLIRTDPLNDTDYTDASKYDDDYIQMDYQFLLPASSTVSVSSTIPVTNFTDVNGKVVKKVDPSFLPLSALRVGERTVVVEIFHQTGFAPGASKFLKMTGFTYLYEYAMY